jgi:hypothetical protein
VKNLLLIVATCLLIQACATSGIKVIDTIPAISRPDWVKSTKEFWQKKNDFYFRGWAQGYADPEIQKLDALASAKSALARQVKSIIREEFKRALEGQKYDPTTGGYLSETFVSVVDNLEVTGAVLADSYNERIKEKSGADYWRSYVLVKLPREEYEKCVKQAFANLRAQVRANMRARDLAEQAEKRFFEREKLKE